MHVQIAFSNKKTSNYPLSWLDLVHVSPSSVPSQAIPSNEAKAPQTKQTNKQKVHVQHLSKVSVCFVKTHHWNFNPEFSDNLVSFSHGKITFVSFNQTTFIIAHTDNIYYSLFQQHELLSVKIQLAVAASVFYSVLKINFVYLTPCR